MALLLLYAFRSAAVIFDCCLAVCQLVLVDPLDLVTPQPDQRLGTLAALGGGEQQALEHVGEVPQVEDVVELHRSWGKHLQSNQYSSYTKMSNESALPAHTWRGGRGWH